MKVFGVPFSNSSSSTNIASTKGTEATYAELAKLAAEWKNKGVSFLSDDLAQTGELAFEGPLHVNRNSRRWPEPVLEIGEHIVFSGKYHLGRAVADGARTAFVGGDHSFSYYLLRAFLATHPNPLLISLDAHPDLCRKGKEAPYHSDWLRFASEVMDPKRIIGIGWRQAEQEEIEYAKAQGIRYLPMYRARPQNLIAAVRDLVYPIVGRLQSENNESLSVYLSIDADVFDPSVAPGVTTPAPFGITSGESIELIRLLASMSYVTAVDLMEIDLARDWPNRQTAILALSILNEFSVRPRF